MLKKLKALNKGTKSKKPHVEHVVALDIGTENVKALIGRIKGDEIEVVGVGRAHQELADMQAGAIADIAGVVKNCDTALNIAEKMAGVSARNVVIGIAGELVKGTTTTVKFTRKEPTKALDMSEVERIIRLVQERAEAKAKQQLAWELGGKDVDIKLVNSALVSITIDGYNVTNPVGFQGRDVLVQLYTAFAPLIHLGALERTAHELDLDLLAVAAEPFAVARGVIGNDPNATTSAILMDIGGGTTDIAVVQEGGVEGTKMFGIGGRGYNKSIERDMNVEFYKTQKIKIACLASEKSVSCRMYNGFGEAVHGFSKNVTQFFGNSFTIGILFWLVTTVGFIPVLLSYDLNFAGLYLLFVLLTRIFVSKASNQNIVINLVYLIPQQLSLFLFLSKALFNRFQNHYEWKGRKI